MPTVRKLDRAKSIGGAALRFGDLRDAYGDVWAQWDTSGEAASWDAVASDGV